MPGGPLRQRLLARDQESIAAWIILDVDLDELGRAAHQTSSRADLPQATSSVLFLAGTGRVHCVPEHDDLPAPVFNRDAHHATSPRKAFGPNVPNSSVHRAG